MLDNAPSHPNADALERENGRFKVTFLPSNVTSLLQPMYQSEEKNSEKAVQETSFKWTFI